jgi:hypothetical protein
VSSRSGPAWSGWALTGTTRRYGCVVGHGGLRVGGWADGCHPMDAP